MDRRSFMKYAGPSGTEGAGSTGSSGSGKKGPIVLHCDLAVDPAREQEMLDHFHNTFKPAAEKFANGYIDVKILKLRTVLQGGPLASGFNYRFQLTYQSEEQRQVWVASDVHSRVWPLIENTLTDKNFLVLLSDSV